MARCVRRQTTVRTHTHPAIITRSKAKSADLYEQIPARVRIVQILLHDWQSQHDQKEHAKDVAHAVEEGDGDEGWEDDEEANQLDAAREERRMAFLDDIFELGLADDEPPADPPYLAPCAALPGFARIAELDRLPVLAQALARTPPDLAPFLTSDEQTSLHAACAYCPT